MFKFLLCSLLFGSLLNAAPEEGVEYVHLKNGYKVWTKRVGTGPIKILTLHGGPGCTHEYFECFEDYFPKDKYQIIYYDQLGSYYSDQPNDKSLWTVERFCEEVEEVRAALRLDDFYLYGQSWGGVLAIEYAVIHPEHIKGLVLSNTTASIASYQAYLNVLKRALPQDVQDKIARFEAAEDFHNPEYEKIVFEEVYTRYLCRVNPWPESLQRMFEHLAKPVYETMQGPNEFVVTGTFRDWNRWDDLYKIKCPTLIISATFDTMDPKDQERMHALIPNSSLIICPNGSHCTMFDDPEHYFPALLNFFEEVDSKYHSIQVSVGKGG